MNLKVGLLRIGDINFVTLNGEAYSRIGIRLKAYFHGWAGADSVACLCCRKARSF